LDKPKSAKLHIGAGNAVAGAYSAVGNGISYVGKGAGNTVSGTTRGWADGIRSYGNAIKDATGAGGSRAVTASNPLGVSGGTGTSIRPGTGSTKPKAIGTARDPLGLNR